MISTIRHQQSMHARTHTENKTVNVLTVQNNDDDVKKKEEQMKILGEIFN